MPSLINRYRNFSSGERNLFWVMLGLCVAILVYWFSIIGDLFITPAITDYAANGVALTIFLLNVASIVVYLNGRTRLGAIICMLAYDVGLLFVPILTSGYALATGVIAFAIPVIFASQLFTHRFIQFLYIGFAILAYSLLADAFWPFSRSAPDSDLAIVQIVAYILLGLVVIVILRTYPNIPLHAKLSTIMLGMSIIPLTIGSILTQQQTRNALADAANQNLLRQSFQAAQNIDNLIKYLLDTIRSESRLDDVIEYLSLPIDQRPGSISETHAREILFTFLQRDPENIQDYFLMDRQGIIALSTDANEIGINNFKKDFYMLPILNGNPYMSSVLVSPNGDNTFFYISTPVKDDKGFIVGILVAQYGAEYLQKVLLSNLEAGEEHSSLMLISDDSIFLANTEQPQQRFKLITPSTKSFEQLVSEERLAGLSTANLFVELPTVAESIKNYGRSTPFIQGEVHTGENTNEYGAITKLANQPWFLIATTDADALLAPVENITKRVLVFAVVISIVSFIISLGVSNLLAAPILRLTHVAERISIGDLNVQAQVETQDEIGQLATVFNQMTVQLREIQAGLEQQIIERTMAIETSAIVGRRLSTILDINNLVGEVVNELQKSFNYYHVHIYLLSEDKDSLILVGGTGQAGQTMLERGHSIPAGRGLVGRAAATGTTVLVADTLQDPGWLPNPLLPDTKSEIAVPLILGEQILGALDVQQNQVNGLTQQDVTILQLIASQVAIAIRNARVYELARQEAEREAQAAAITEAIRATDNVTDALKIAVREVGRVLGAPKTQVRLKPGTGEKNLFSDLF